MAPTVSSVEIARGADDVFSYVTDPAHFPEWQTGVVKAGMVNGVPPAVGSRCTITRRIGGSERTTTQEIVEHSPPRGWAIRGIDGPIRAHVSVRVEPLEAERSRLTIALELHAHGMARVLLPAVRRAAAAQAPSNVERIKQRLEAGE
ncbi:MAG TPA: SRPBCC family protein [Solirubrobacteraceae bacterium]|nr:SRPBCC family protein [Solirubrobacteraceae bacterium]